MKITENQLRIIIKDIVKLQLDEASSSLRNQARKMRNDIANNSTKLETFGDLKRIIRMSIGSKEISRGTEAAGKFSNLIPGVGTVVGAVDLFSFLIKISGKSAVETKGLDRLKTDPQISSIVSDDIEEEFLKKLLKDIENRREDEPLGDWNSTAALKSYIASIKNGRTITGFPGE